MSEPKKPRTGAEVWRAIENMEADDDMEEILAMSEDELDADLRAHGMDPEAIGARTAALVNELLESRARLAWQKDAHAKLAAVRAMAEASRTKEKLPRAELLRRVAAARSDPRLGGQVSVLFHKKTEEASTDEELQALVDGIALLRKLEDEDGSGR